MLRKIVIALIFISLICFNPARSVYPCSFKNAELKYGYTDKKAPGLKEPLKLGYKDEEKTGSDDSYGDDFDDEDDGDDEGEYDNSGWLPPADLTDKGGKDWGWGDEEGTGGPGGEDDWGDEGGGHGGTGGKEDGAGGSGGSEGGGGMPIGGGSGKGDHIIDAQLGTGPGGGGDDIENGEKKGDEEDKKEEEEKAEPGKSEEPQKTAGEDLKGEEEAGMKDPSTTTGEDEGKEPKDDESAGEKSGNAPDEKTAGDKNANDMAKEGEDKTAKTGENEEDKTGKNADDKPADSEPSGDNKDAKNSHKEDDGGSGGGSGESGKTQTGQTTGGEPVILPTGNFFSEETDLNSKRVDTVFLFKRYYNSLNAETDGVFGHGWSHTFDIHVVYLDKGILVRWGDGTKHYYKRHKGKYLKPKGVYNDLIKDDKDNVYVITPAKTRYTFDSRYHRNVTRISDLNGTLFSIEYNLITQKISKVTDRWGNWIAFEYNGSNKVSGAEDSAGRKVKYKYDRFRSDLTSVTDIIGDEVSYRYDRKHNLTRKSYSDGVELVMKCDRKHRVLEQGNEKESGVFRFEYDDKNKKVVFFEGKNRKAEYHYNDDRKIIKETDAAGYSSERGYDKYGNLISYKDRRGGVFKFNYDSRGNLIEKIDAVGSRVRFEYDPKTNRLSGIINGLGVKTEFARDERGNLIEAINGEGAQTKFVNDEYGRPVEITAPNGNRTEITYDKKGNVETVKSPLIKGVRGLSNGKAASNDSIVISYKRDVLGNAVEYSDPNGTVTKYGYDIKGRLISIQKQGQKSAIEMAYDQFDNIVSVKDAMGNVTSYSYTKDWWNNLAGVTDAAGTQWQNVYDIYGKLLEKIDGNGGRTKYIYDARGSVIEAAAPNGDTRRYGYDAGGVLTNVIDGNGNSNEYVYDGVGRLTGVKDGEGFTVRQEFDAAGNLTKVIDPKGGIVSFFHDKVGRLIKESDQEENERAYIYGPAGELAAVIDGEGRKTLFQYDPVGRLRQKILSNGSEVLFEYDRNGNITKIESEGKGKIETEYDIYNRIMSVSAGGKEIKYEYDLNGNRRKMSVGEDVVVKYLYDRMNRVEAIESGADVVRYAYDRVGRRAKRIIPDDIATEYSYDPSGNLTLLETKTRGGKVLDSYKYGYDKAANRVTMTSMTGEAAYTYDKKNQLIAAAYPDGASETFAYDGNGNRVKRTAKGKAGLEETTYTYNTANQLVSFSKNNPLTPFSKGDNTGSQVPLSKGGTGVVKFEYDKNGNLVKEAIAGIVTEYVYDLENRLASVTKGGKTAAEFLCDLLGRREAKREGEKFTGYMYDGVDILMELDEKGVVAAKFLNGAGIDEPIAVESAGVKSYYLQDGLGSVSAILGKKGRIQERFSYNAFGDSPKPVSRFGFTAREYDASTGLYYYRARYYNSRIGRFTQADPLGMPDGVNRYIYCLNNPVNWVDPWGLLTIIVPGTWYDGKWAEEGTPFNSSVSETFGEQAVVFKWSNEDNSSARMEAAARLQDFIDRNRNPGEKVNIVGHSHGGNVGFLTAKAGTQIDVLVTLGTPIREYRANYENVGKVLNVYSKDDAIQVIGGKSVNILGQEGGLAERRLPEHENVQNVELEGYGHSDLHSSDVWDKISKRAK